MFHDHETERHLGELEMYNIIRQHYTTGGWVYEPLLKTTYRVVAHANNSKLTDTLQNWHFYLPKVQSQLGHSQTAP